MYTNGPPATASQLLLPDVYVSHGCAASSSAGFPYISITERLLNPGCPRRPALHGQLGPQQQRLTVLHHLRQDGLAGREARGVWGADGGSGGAASHGGGQGCVPLRAAPSATSLLGHFTSPVFLSSVLRDPQSVHMYAPPPPAAGTGVLGWGWDNVDCRGSQRISLRNTALTVIGENSPTVCVCCMYMFYMCGCICFRHKVTKMERPSRRWSFQIVENMCDGWGLWTDTPTAGSQGTLDGSLDLGPATVAPGNGLTRSA